MATLLCQQYPYLQIFNPATGAFVRFVGGKLEIEEGDPNFTVVMAEASRNPAIRVLTEDVQCVHCGDTFGDGKAAKASLGKHVKDVHFEVWQADQDAEHASVIHAEMKARASHFCDVCRPMQEFPDAETLAGHVGLFHAAPPPMDEEGNLLGSGDGASGAAPVDLEVPAAKPSKRRAAEG